MLSSGKFCIVSGTASNFVYSEVGYRSAVFYKETAKKRRGQVFMGD